MPVISSHKDTENLTLSIVAEFEATVERVWQLWEDPRQLEQWWGPPTYPATFEFHEFTPNGRARYYMTAPDGEKFRSSWQFTEISPTHRIEFVDGGADGEFNPNAEMGPARIVVTLQTVESSTRMTVTSHFDSIDALESVLDMGMEEGMKSAMGQIDDLLSQVGAQA